MLYRLINMLYRLNAGSVNRSCPPVGGGGDPTMPTVQPGGHTVNYSPRAASLMAKAGDTRPKTAGMQGRSHFEVAFC